MHDEEPALVYYNYRFYNPKDGRWINRDPIAEEGGWNLYGFVDNNSIDSFDRSGLFFDRLVSAAISAAVDIGIQVTTNIIEGKPADDIDWVSVGAAAVSGAIIPGVSVMKSCQKFGQVLSKNQRVVTKIVELQNKISVLKKYGKLKSVTKLQYEQAVLIQTNNYMWTYYVKEEFTIYTLKITNKALAKGIIQSWGISSDLDNIDDCTIQVIVGEKTSVAGTAERLSTRTIPPTSPLLPSRPWPVLN
jgi:YD repeat protein